MKRCLFLLLLGLTLLLTGCGSKRGEGDFRAFSERLNNLDTLSFNAQVRAEYEHKTARFALSYAEDGEGGRVTVVAPELIRGVTARVSPGGSTLEHDTVVLDTGSLDAFGLSPLSSLPMMLRAMRTGHVDSVWEEDGKLVVMLESDDALRCCVWFSTEEMRPLRAEISRDGRVTVYLDISDWAEGR